MFADTFLFMLLLHQFLSSNFLLALALSSDSCSWPNGAKATNYVVCNPAASQSSCCREGEACLQNGLCYGAIGFMYRGACAGFVLISHCSLPCCQERSAANRYITAAGVILPHVQIIAALSQVLMEPGPTSGPAPKTPLPSHIVQIGGVAWTVLVISPQRMPYLLETPSTRFHLLAKPL